MGFRFGGSRFNRLDKQLVLPATPAERLLQIQNFWQDTIGALMIRIGSWGPSHHNYNKEPLK